MRTMKPTTPDPKNPNMITSRVPVIEVRIWESVPVPLEPAVMLLMN